MISKPIISIIIPVYNRATLLPMTIASIKAQTFTDWECILIDDHSTDNSLEIMWGLQINDARIKAFLRPSHLKKGANSSRNFGFLQATGKYIKWFDSDDLMLPHHLELVYQTLIRKKVDFVISDTENFDHATGELVLKTYDFDRELSSINAENYALNTIGWITDDFFGKKKILENIKFNENLIDGDEYNFMIKLLEQTQNGILLKDVLSKRRIHKDSISVLNRKNEFKYKQIVAAIKYQTAKDLEVYKDVQLIRWFLSGYMQYAFEIAKSRNKVPNSFAAFLLISKYYTISKGLVYLLSIAVAQITRKGFIIMKYART
jgi:glycosyltransferase involved in cell wall biosynthesis